MAVTFKKNICKKIYKNSMEVLVFQKPIFIDFGFYFIGKDF